MAAKLDEAQERIGSTVAPPVPRDELLVRQGVRTPTRKDAAPFRSAGPRRPRWLAFLLRLFA